jgi:nicotinamide-nucleotide amidase
MPGLGAGRAGAGGRGEAAEHGVDGEEDPMASDDSMRDVIADAVRLADVIHGRLVEAHHTVAVAESLTGGLLATFLTTAPATSVTFRGGLAVYSTDLKHTLAGVPQDLLDRLGAVHPDIAGELAAGVRSRLDADYGLGVTGVAGPGGQDGHPVGEVFVAVAGPEGSVVQRHDLSGDRAAVRVGAARAALSDLLDVLDGRLEVASRDDTVDAR